MIDENRKLTRAEQLEYMIWLYSELIEELNIELYQFKNELEEEKQKELKLKR